MVTGIGDEQLSLLGTSAGSQPHRSSASPSQRVSQDVSQQNGSTAQTVSQQPGHATPSQLSSQNGVPLPPSWKQSPVSHEPHAASASQRPHVASTHWSSQSMTQQNARVSQTRAQQTRSSQPGEPFASSHGPDIGSPQDAGTGGQSTQGTPSPR